ncbi:MAG: hypothetical protein E7381_05500 [Clostridiales bacterium]|nr:hypothetical protein [Clostridiales bacterium]
MTLRFYNKDTAEEVKKDGNPFETTGKWVNYYELNEGYGDGYEEAVVYIYNLPDTKYATEFYVCSEIVLNDNTSELSEVVCRSMSGVSASAINSGEYKVAELENYLEEVDYQVNNYLRTVFSTNKRVIPYYLGEYDKIRKNYKYINQRIRIFKRHPTPRFIYLFL